MLGPFPIINSLDVYNVFKMDVISEALSPWGTHPEFAAIRTQMLHECNVSDSYKILVGRSRTCTISTGSLFLHTLIRRTHIKILLRSSELIDPS